MQMYEDEIFGAQSAVHPPEGTNTIKASLFTLIVIAENQERKAHAQNLVHIIASKYPCKIIFISIDSDAPETFFRHEYSSRTITEGSTCLSCDVLLIDTSQEQLHKVPFLVIPEISSDVPTFLLVAHEPTSIPLVTQLEPYVGRVVFESARVNNVGAFASSILSLPNKTKYVDIIWAKTKPWRESLLRVFSNEERINNLNTCSRIDIRYSKKPGVSFESVSDAQALLLQAWLSSRLSWELISIDEEKEFFHIKYSKDHKTISVILSSTDNDIMEEGSITNIEICGDNNLHYLLAYERDDRHIAVHASSQDRCEMPYTLFVGSFQKGRALPSEIFQHSLSEQYLPSLEALASPLWQKDRSTT